MQEDSAVPHGFAKPYFLLIFLLFVGIILWNKINKGKVLVIARGSALFTGMITGMVVRFYKPFQSYTNVILDSNPNYYLALLYSIHLFHDTFSFDPNVFVKAWAQITLISVTMFLMSSMVTGFFIFYSLIESTINVPLAIIYGILVSHTSAFEISIHLEYIPRMRHLQTLLKGESLFSEPIMMSIYIIAMRAYKTNQEEHLQYFLIFLQLVAGPIVVGLVLGWILMLLMKKYSVDATRLMLYTFIWSLMGYYICSELELLGPIAVITIGCFALSEKESIGTFAAHKLVTFWSVVLKLAFYVLLCISGINLVERVTSSFHSRNGLIFLVTLLTIYCSRIITLLLISPILSRIGYGMTMQEASIIALGASRGGSSIFLAWNLLLSKDKALFILGRHLYVNICLLLLLTSFMSRCFHPWMFKISGIHGITAARKNNMDTCMKYINTKRDQFVSILKMDKFLGDAKWPLVYELCQLHHPYKYTTKSRFADKEEVHEKETKLVICPECLNEIPQQPSTAEMAEITWECRMRILKSKKISYSRQYENGVLMKNAFRTLNNAIETAMNSPEAILKLDELFKMFRLNQETVVRKKKRTSKWLQINHKEMKPPKKRFRRICLKLMTHSYFDIIIYTIILINSAIIIYAEISKLTSYSKTWYIFVTVDFMFMFIYVLEFIIKILGYSVNSICRDGFSMYFKSIWNIIDFIILIVMFFHAFYTICLFFSSCLTMFYSKRLKCAFLSLRLVRLLRIVKIIGVVLQKMKNYKINRANNRIMLAYEIGKGFVAGDEGLEDMIYQTVSNKSIRDDCLERIKTDRLAVTRHLGLVQKERPWIANTVKTKQACMVVLNSMKEVVVELKTSGGIDEFEYKCLTSGILQEISDVERITSVIQNTPKELFRETSWMDGDKNLADYLFQHVITKIFDVDDIICREGEYSDGVYIIISGLLKLTYIPNTKTIGELTNNGQLPIVDFINNINYTESFEEYITSGNSFGELSVLTDRPYNCSICADTPVQAYVLTRDVLSSAFNLFYDQTDGLESRMWKTVALRIGPLILTRVPIFQSLSKIGLQYHLAESFVPNTSHYKMLVMPTSIVEDILLIDGVARDYHSNFHFKAPCFIPRNVQKLILPKSSRFQLETTIEPKLLVIPGVEANRYDIIIQIDSNSEMTPSATRFHAYSGNHLKWLTYKRHRQLKANSRRIKLAGQEKKQSRATGTEYALKQSVSFSTDQFSDEGTMDSTSNSEI